MSYDKDSLILSHIELAKNIANKEWRTATHALKQDDMLSLAYMGLVDAAQRWEPYCAKNNYSPEATQYFKVFASFRIRGTIRDHIRKEDWATRTLRTKSKKLKNAGQDEGIPVEELAEKTGMSVPEINKVNARMATKPVSLEAHLGNPYQDNPTTNELEDKADTEGTAFARTMVRLFVETVQVLPEEIKLVVILHYYKKLDLKRVAEELGFSEAKVSQLHASGVLAVRDALALAANERN